MARLERAPFFILSQELHATHMQIHGILGLQAQAPVEPDPHPFSTELQPAGSCEACRDGWKIQCDNVACANFYPPRHRAEQEQTHQNSFNWTNIDATV